MKFTVHGDPKGQPRPRAFAVKGKVRVYDPGTAENWKSAIAAAVPQPVAMMGGPVHLRLTFMFGRPKAHYRKDGQLVPNAPVCHTSKPDADNAAKAVMDALTQIGVWRDDAQIARLTVEKRYVICAERPGCVVTIIGVADEEGGE